MASDPSQRADLGATEKKVRRAEHKIKDAQQPPGWGHGSPYNITTQWNCPGSMTSKHLPFTPLPEKVIVVSPSPPLHHCILGVHMMGKGMGQAAYLFSVLIC